MKKKTNNVIWDFINNNTNFIYLILITILALVIRGVLVKYNSGDYDMFLRPWFDALKLNGGLNGLSQDIGNYTPIYMTILSLLTYIPLNSLVSIKIVSIIFDFIGAYAVLKIVKELLKDKKYKDKVALLFYALYLFIPTVFLNSAYWAQSDGIYTAFILISLYYLIKNNFKIGFLFFSIAFAFKFQAIFIFPLYVLMFLTDRKIKLRYLLILPAVIFVLSIPKVIYSHDLLAGFKVYINQAGTYSQYITLNFPNVYSIFLKGNGSSNLIDTPFSDLSTIGIIITFVILITLAYFVIVKKVKFDKKAIIEFGLFSILITTFFLPQMHERYLYMGDVLAIIYLVINVKKFYVPIIIEYVSLYGYMYYLFGGSIISFPVVGAIFLVLMIIFSRDMIKTYLMKE